MANDFRGLPEPEYWVLPLPESAAEFPGLQGYPQLVVEVGFFKGLACFLFSVDIVVGHDYHSPDSMSINGSHR